MPKIIAKNIYLLLISKLKRLDIVFILGCLLGAIVFILIYGMKILNFTYDDWLMSGGDLSTHYLGWRFFRVSDWNFPFGLMNGINYPNKVSIIYNDSIPLFSILFKILSPILPDKFQYFGLWGILSFMLQGGISSLIIKKFNTNKWIRSIGSLLFIISPIMIGRMFGHTALAGHWLILLSIYIWVNKKNFLSIKSNLIIWSILISLCVSIHSYFIPMVVIILFCYLLQDYLETRNIKRQLIIFLSSTLSGLIVMFLLGAFSGDTVLDIGGLGFYSSNINSLLNSQGWSKYLTSLPLATGGQYEGFAYLGLGTIILILISTYINIDKIVNFKFNINKNTLIFNFKGNTHNTLVVLAFLIGFILSLSPIVTLNEHTLFTIKYPVFITNILNIFRVSGRLIWIPFYIITIYAIKIVITNSSKKTAIVILGISVILQISDISIPLKQRYDNFSVKNVYSSPLKSEIWNILSNNEYKHIVLLDDSIVGDLNSLYGFCKYAVDNNMTINDTYLARKDYNAVNSTKQKYISDLKNGISEDNIIYVFSNLSSTLDESYPLNYYYVNNFIIGVKNKIVGIKNHNLLYKETDIYKYLEKINNPNYMVIISAKDEFSTQINADIIKRFSNLGLKEDITGKYRWSYIAIINSNTVEYESLNNNVINYMNTFDELNINVTSAGMEAGNISSIKINDIEYSKNSRGLNIVVYDKELQTIIDSVCFDTNSGLGAIR